MTDEIEELYEVYRAMYPKDVVRKKLHEVYVRMKTAYKVNNHWFMSSWITDLNEEYERDQYKKVKEAYIHLEKLVWAAHGVYGGPEHLPPPHLITLGDLINNFFYCLEDYITITKHSKKWDRMWNKHMQREDEEFSFIFTRECRDEFYLYVGIQV